MSQSSKLCIPSPTLPQHLSRSVGCCMQSAKHLVPGERVTSAQIAMAMGSCLPVWSICKWYPTPGCSKHHTPLSHDNAPSIGNQPTWMSQRGSLWIHTCAHDKFTPVLRRIHTCVQDKFTPVFILSTQAGSTGPSNMTQCMSDDASATADLITLEASPSVQSWVTGLYDPYSSDKLTAWGART